MNTLHLLPGCRVERIHRVKPSSPGQADAPPLASPRQLAWLLHQPASKLDAWQKATVTQVEQDIKDLDVTEVILPR